MRIRDRDNLSKFTCDRMDKRNGVVVLQNTFSSLQRSNGVGKVIIDNGPTKFKPGIFIQNPVEFRSYKGSATNGALYQSALVSKVRYENVVSGPLTMFPDVSPVYGPMFTWNALDEARCLQAAHAGISSPDFDLGMFLAEGKQTIDMIRAPLLSATKGIKQLVDPIARYLNKISRRPGPFSLKKDLLRAKKAIDKAASLWLQTRYGVMPLISDVDAMRKRYHEQALYDANAIHRRTGGFMVSKTNEIIERGGQLAGFYTTVKDIVVTSQHVSSHVYFHTTLGNTSVGGGIYDIPNLIWELTPFSFVVDWAFNIGDWLRNIMPKPGYSYLGNHVTTKRSVKVERHIIATRGTDYRFVSKILTPSFSTHEWDHMIRYINRPIPVLPVPNLDCLNLTRSIDSLTLAWQKLAPKVFH